MAKPRNNRPRMTTTSLGEDRISALPDEILVIILSHLVIHEAARTSLLSRRWRMLWTLTPVMKLGFMAETVSERRRQMGWLNLVLDSHRGLNLTELEFHLDSRGIEKHCDLSRWVDFAMRRKVQVFDLKIFSWREPFELGKTVYSFPNISNAVFSSLKSLSLQLVKLTSQQVESFVSICPCLEELRLQEMDWIQNTVRIESESLKLLDVSCCFGLRKLEIVASSLTSLAYSGRGVEFDFKKAPLLVEVSFFESYCNVLFEHRFKPLVGVVSQLKKLKLHLGYPWLAQFPKVDEVININTLELNMRVWNPDKLLLLCSSMLPGLPLLEKFTLNLFWPENFQCDETWVALAKNHRHHSLKVIELVGFVGCKVDSEIVRYLILNAMSLEKLTLHPCRRYWIDRLEDSMSLEEKNKARERAAKLGAMRFDYTRLCVL